MPARLLTLTGSFPAVLEDISLTGAKITVSDFRGENRTFHMGEDVLVQWCEFEAMGKLVWQDGEICGVEFEPQILPSQLIQTRDHQDEFTRTGGVQEMRHSAAKEWATGNYS